MNFQKLKKLCFLADQKSLFWRLVNLSLITANLQIRQVEVELSMLPMLQHQKGIYQKKIQDNLQKIEKILHILEEKIDYSILGKNSVEDWVINFNLQIAEEEIN